MSMARRAPAVVLKTTAPWAAFLLIRFSWGCFRASIGMTRLLHEGAAVHVEHGPGHERGIRRDEKSDRAGHVLDGSEPPERRFGDLARGYLGAGVEARHLRLHARWCDAV